MSIADLLLLLLIAIDIVAIVSTLNSLCFSRFVSCVHFFVEKHLHKQPVLIYRLGGKGCETGCETGWVGAGRGGAERVGAADFGGITWF